jgi:hypothetical protein
MFCELIIIQGSFLSNATLQHWVQCGLIEVKRSLAIAAPSQRALAHLESSLSQQA